jgi:hypothetical protein
MTNRLTPLSAILLRGDTIGFNDKPKRMVHSQSRARARRRAAETENL